MIESNFNNANIKLAKTKNYILHANKGIINLFNMKRMIFVHIFFIK